MIASAVKAGDEHLEHLNLCQHEQMCVAEQSVLQPVQQSVLALLLPAQLSVLGAVSSLDQLSVLVAMLWTD